MPIEVTMLDKIPTQEEQKAFTDCIVALHGDNYADYPWSEHWCAMHFRQFCTNKDIDVFMVHDDGIPLGFAIGMYSNLWFSPSRQYDEVIVVVTSGQSPMQKARVTKKLLDSLEWAANVRKCQVVCVGTSTGYKSAAYLRVLERRGFQQFGTTMRKVL